jgi:hypothetical protein
MGAFNAGMKFFCLVTGRKRYFRMDPYRNHPSREEQPSGPSFSLYSGTWKDLVELFTIFYKNPANGSSNQSPSAG